MERANLITENAQNVKDDSEQMAKISHLNLIGLEILRQNGL